MALPDERFEICHRLDAQTRERILPALSVRLGPCPLSDPAGRQRVQSLYFGPAPGAGGLASPRRRLRIRLHESAGRASRCVVEIKHRVGLRSAIRQASVTLSDAVLLAAGMAVPPSGGPASVIEEALDLMRDGLRPSCLVSHERIALVGGPAEADLRVTLDHDLRSRTRDLVLRAGEARSGVEVIAPDETLLVVKVARSVPHWLTLLLGRSGPARRSPGKHELAARVGALSAADPAEPTTHGG